MAEKKPKNYTRRTVEDFSDGKYRFQLFGRLVTVKTLFRLFYKIEFVGQEKIPKSGKYIVSPNHTSLCDPFISGEYMDMPLAYMGKKELFENKIIAFLLDWLACFAVNREKLEVSTMKTAIDICKTEKWHLGIFPQGERVRNKRLENINKGFAVLAKQMKVNILPMAITGLEQSNWNPFKRKPVKVELGDMISYDQSYDEIIDEWCTKIAAMTGYEYVKPEMKEEKEPQKV